MVEGRCKTHNTRLVANFDTSRNMATRCPVSGCTTGLSHEDILDIVRHDKSMNDFNIIQVEVTSHA